MDYDSEPAKQPEVQEVRRTKDEPGRAFEDAYNLSVKQTEPWKGQPVSVGAVDRIDIPPQWKEGKREDNVRGNSSYREFIGTANDGGRISFFDRGLPLSDSSASVLKSILSKQAGSVSKVELFPIASELLGPVADPSKFDMNSISVAKLNGKNVLEIQGRYLDEPEGKRKDSKQIFVDVLGNGKIIQEIELQSQQNKTVKLGSTFEKILKSIKWH